MFAYGVSGTFADTYSLYTFSLGSDGTLIANPSVSLPAPTDFWETVNRFSANTIDLIDQSSLDFLVYPVSSSGVAGATHQTTTLAGLPQFPFSVNLAASSGVQTVSELPTLWVFPGSATIDELAINPDGTIGGSSGSVPTGGGVQALGTGQAPFAYGVDGTSETVYGYQVDATTGALTFEGSFVPTIPSGQTLSPPAFPFQPLSYSSSPVALFVYASGGSNETVVVYPLGSNGMPPPPATPLDTISTPGIATESYVVLGNGQVQTTVFDGG